MQRMGDIAKPLSLLPHEEGGYAGRGAGGLKWDDGLELGIHTDHDAIRVVTTFRNNVTGNVAAIIQTIAGILAVELFAPVDVQS